MSKRAIVIPSIILVVAALFFVINGRRTRWSGGRAEQPDADNGPTQERRWGCERKEAQQKSDRRRLRPSGHDPVEHPYLWNGAEDEVEDFDSVKAGQESARGQSRQSEGGVTVQVEIAYNKVEQMQSLTTVAEDISKTRTEAALIADRQFEQDAALASARAEAAAKMGSAKASLLEANLGLSLAQGELKRAMGEVPR